MASNTTNKLILFKITQETLNKYENNSEDFSKPRLVAYYEYKYGTLENANRIKYFKKPQPNQYPIDLKKGIETYVRDKSLMYSRKLEASLKYDMSKDDKNKNENKTKVITNQNTLMHIMESYYNEIYNELFIRVSRYNGNLYMVIDRADNRNNEMKETEKYHGIFNQHLFADSPNKEPNINEPVDKNIALIGVYRCNFGKYNIIQSGEIEGIMAKEEINKLNDLDVLNDCRFVAAKQYRNDLKNYDNNYLKCWLNSYLTNVEEMYFGYRTQESIIDKPIDRIEVKDLPKNKFWKPKICMGLLYDFLKNVEEKMSSVNCLNTVYLVHYNREEKSFTYENFDGKNDKSFISEEYMKYCGSQNAEN